MIELIKKLEEIESLFTSYKTMKEEAHALEAAIYYDKVLELLEGSKKNRKKAIQKLHKLAETCGFRICKKIDFDRDFIDVFHSIKWRIDQAVEALRNIDQCEHNIELVNA